MIVLCADDYGLSGGVSRGIAELCAEARLSATSAMVTFARWHEDAQRLRDLREAVAIGLHLNLTLGEPMIAEAGAAHLKADGSLPGLGWLIGQAVLRRLDRKALTRECRAQINAFAEGAGVLPDFIDGHQHAHALPAVRDALLDAIADFDWPTPPLVRVPSDRRGAAGTHRREGMKRTITGLLAYSFRARLEAAGLPSNDTFAGFSAFEPGSDYGVELRAALAGGGRCHLVMCHPGHVDAGLAARGDPVVARREEELNAIMAFDGLATRIWHPTRTADGSIDWAKAMTA